ncbi:hypothetical protein GOBAR_DD36485 [Gossypium barbadense]|nr:hypothetical protein GOBAR_DD36485 [Gossypium barbadense]
MEGKVESLWEEVRELTLGTTVDRLQSPPTPLQFLRDFADALVPHPSQSSLCFVSAHVQPTLFPQALDLIRRPPNHLVAYLQQQNDCFRTEYSVLESDCDAHIPWASEALGCLPEAVNLWIGNHLSQTSFHKDHYENLYAVVSGEKHFLLLPPTDVHRMYIKEYPAARYSYSQENGEFRLEFEEPERYVPWSSVDPCPARASLKQESLKFPLYFNGPKPFEFDIKYAYFNFLQSLPCRSIDDQTIPEGDCEDDSGPHASSNHLNSRFSGDESATNNVEIHKDRDNVQGTQENVNDCEGCCRMSTSPKFSWSRENCCLLPGNESNSRDLIVRNEAAILGI